MPRTKQTAKKSTGGHAKRKLLVPATRTLRSKSLHSGGVRQSPQPAIDIEMAAEPSASEFIHHNNNNVLTNGPTLQVLLHRLMPMVLRLGLKVTM